MKDKIKKWWYQSLVDDFYKGNNSTLNVFIMLYGSLFFGYGYNIKGLLFIFVSIFLAEWYFRKGRDMYLLAFYTKYINNNKNGPCDYCIDDKDSKTRYCSYCGRNLQLN